MKTTIHILIMLLFIGNALTAQQLIVPKKGLKDYYKTRTRYCNDNQVNQLPYQQSPGNIGIGFSEDLLGQTVYDLQSNTGSPHGRLVRFDDGTFGSVWTRGMNPTAYSDRGTGYNYFDGTSWGTSPTGRIESLRAGWPSIVQLGASGEAVVAHRNATSPLRFSKRPTKGSGTWTESDIPGPVGASGIEWPRMVRGGIDNNTLHIIALTGPTSLGGTVYNGQDGALVYTKSNDLGNTWSTPVVLDGLGSSYYRDFSGDVYEFAEPIGNNLAFVIVDNSTDMILMRSSDNGDTWQKTILWEHPYPFLDPGTTATDTIYCPDRSVSLAFDKTGKLHVVFGVYRVRFLGDDTYNYWPGMSGIIYWNDQMPTFTGGDQKNILDPDLLDVQGLQIGYYNIDWDGDGELTYVDGDDFYGDYGCAWASMPQIAFDDNNNAIFIYSSLIEHYDNGTQNYRHIWCRASSDNAATWGPIIDLSDDPVHMFDECVFPVLASGSDDNNWYYTYMIDNEPGLAIDGDEDPPSDNYNNFYHLSKILNSKKESVADVPLQLSQNYPNPVSATTQFDLLIGRPSWVYLILNNSLGLEMTANNFGYLNTGSHKLELDLSGYPPGIYFYRLETAFGSYSGKLIKK